MKMRLPVGRASLPAIDDGAAGRDARPWSFYILQVCHPERRLPESKDLAAAVFAAVICPGATMRR
jgi:hypothetical protein